MVFALRSEQAAWIRKEANYEGVRVTLLGTLDNARCSVQIDAGYGDAVMPAAELVQFPALLEDVAPRQAFLSKSKHGTGSYGSES